MGGGGGRMELMGGLGLGLGLGFMLATGLSRFCKVQPFRKRYSNS